MEPGNLEPLTLLINQASQGDGASWDKLVRRFERLVWSVVSGFRLSEADSLDAAQVTWLRLVENLGKLNEPDRVGSWLATTARRESLRILARRNRSEPVDPGTFDHLKAFGDQYQTVDQNDEFRSVLRAIDKLSPNCRLLLSLLLSDPSPTYQEIAASLEISVGTIGPRRLRCLGELRSAASRILAAANSYP